MIDTKNNIVMKQFPRFWFEGNLFFNWVENLDDLQRVFDAYDGYLTKDEVLDKALNKDDKLDEFGLRMEHKGSVTLRQFLNEKGIDWGNDGVVKCPECLKKTSQEELDMFGGVCEECSGAFDESSG